MTRNRLTLPLIIWTLVCLPGPVTAQGPAQPWHRVEEGQTAGWPERRLFPPADESPRITTQPQSPRPAVTFASVEEPAAQASGPKRLPNESRPVAVLEGDSPSSPRTEPKRDWLAGLASGWPPAIRFTFAPFHQKAPSEATGREGDGGEDGPVLMPSHPLPAQPVVRWPTTAVRFGWWSVHSDGSPVKVGEFQDLGSSPFWDIDALWIGDQRSVDLFATGLDQEATQLGLAYFGPHLSVDLEYDRYLRRLDHDPLSNFPTPESEEPIVAEDIHAGQDYAIRVQELKTSVHGFLGRALKYRVNVWMLRKHGERQARAMQHSSDPSSCTQCHVLSQRQRIDWLTTQIEPVLEAGWGPVTVEYSRPMRFFSQNDQVVTRTFNRRVHTLSEDNYALVPENFTQIDRLKVSAHLPVRTQFYGRVLYGDTRNRFRDTHRRFYGYDLRLTNRWWKGWTRTGYAAHAPADQPVSAVSHRAGGQFRGRPHFHRAPFRLASSVELLPHRRRGECLLASLPLERIGLGSGPQRRLRTGRHPARVCHVRGATDRRRGEPGA